MMEFSWWKNAEGATQFNTLLFPHYGHAYLYNTIHAHEALQRMRQCVPVQNGLQSRKKCNKTTEEREENGGRVNWVNWFPFSCVLQQHIEYS